MFGTPPDIKNDPHPVKTLPGPGHVRFEHVGFDYEPGRPVLHDVDLDVPAGRSVAIVGPSGAGKSTLVVLLPRLYDVTSGRILIDDIDIRQIQLRQLRRAIGIVQQEPFLFSTTIRENIAYGSQDAPIERIVAAAQAANADGFIERLPDGYDAVVGEHGLTLSGGERQRICLARTLLKDPLVLILDEATSSLDSESENLVQAAMERLMKGRTSFIIAHRLSTIMNADFVVVMEGGRIVERGTHATLWREGGLYARLLEEQFGPLRNLMEKSQTSAPAAEMP